MKCISTNETFVPAHKTIWGIMPDAWDDVDPRECYMFLKGFVQLAKGGHWFPYRGNYSTLKVNLTNPHVIQNTTIWQCENMGNWSEGL